MEALISPNEGEQVSPGPEAKGLNFRDEGVGEGPSPAAGEHAGGRHHAVVMGCWVCGPVGRGGEPQRAIQPAAKCDDGVSGYSQHKSFRCPHNAARSGEQIRPRRLDPEEAARVIAGCSVVVGLHPDQATGDIVDFALETNKPFALVPCCTFAQTFQDRVLADGKRVSTYEDPGVIREVLLQGAKGTRIFSPRSLGSIRPCMTKPRQPRSWSPSYRMTHRRSFSWRAPEWSCCQATRSERGRRWTSDARFYTRYSIITLQGTVLLLCI